MCLCARAGRRCRCGGVDGDALRQGIQAERATADGREQWVLSRARVVSVIQARSTVAVAAVSGVMRCFRPLPRQLTCAAVSRWMSSRVNEISSDARSPVWTASVSRAWSRRPVRVVAVGRVEQGLCLDVGEVGDHGVVAAFGGDREHAADVVGVLGVPQRGEGEQGVDRGQAGVAGARRCCLARVRGDRGTRRSFPRLRSVNSKRWQVVPVRALAKASSIRMVSR